MNCGPLPDASQSVQDAFEASASRAPQKVALITKNARLTYGEVEALANRLASGLRASGVGRGDRVLIYLQNTWEAAVSVFAILKAGGVFVVVNRGAKSDKLAYIARNCGAVAIVTDERAAGTVLDSLKSACPSLRLSIVTGKNWDSFVEKQSADRPSRINDPSDLACLVYTSGSTGEPKGVMSAHSNVVFAAGSIISYLKNLESDVVIGLLPLSFDYGLYQLLMTFTFGGTLVLEESFAFPAVILKRIAEEKVTGLPGVPSIFTMLLQLDLTKFDTSSLRYISNTAAALPPGQIAEIRKKFPGVTLYSMYGLTETKRTLYLPPEELDRRPGSVGIAIPGTEVWVEDEHGKQLGAEEVGELVVRGPHVMRGYWGDEILSAMRFRPGLVPGERLCYTGDLFRHDAEGFYYFVGRKDDIIKSRGEKVAPKEVENILYGLAGIREAAVVGVPDPVLGQAVKAIVVADESLTAAQILAHCRDRLENFMVPKYVEIRSEMPKTSSGKIAKRELV